MRPIGGNVLIAAVIATNSAMLACSGHDQPSASVAQAGRSSVSSAGQSTTSLQSGGANGTGGTSSAVAESSANTAGNVGTGGTVAATGGSSTGGLSSSGGSVPRGGVPGSGGSFATTGGSPDSGGVSAAGATKSTGGNSVTGGGSATGGASSNVGGNGSGICPGGTYPAPTLGTATRVYTTTGNGQFEGTVWYSNSVLLFSNMATGSTNPIVPSAVDRLTPSSTVEVLVADSGSNGMALDRDGSLLACSHKVQGIVTIDTATSAVTMIVNTDSSGKHFNSPNDLTVRTDGTIYFTDPDYQLGSTRTSETGIKGVYRVSPSRQVTLIDGTFGEPNGIALSPDESTLYVADMNANAIRKFTVAADGTTSAKTNFATVTNPDGVAVDCAGNLYFASNSGGKVVVLSPTGAQLGTIAVASGVTNLAFGGVDHKTLYISAGMSLYSVPMNVPGFPY